MLIRPKPRRRKRPAQDREGRPVVADAVHQQDRTAGGVDVAGDQAPADRRQGVDPVARVVHVGVFGQQPDRVHGGVRGQPGQLRTGLDGGGQQRARSLQVEHRDLHPRRLADRTDRPEVAQPPTLTHRALACVRWPTSPPSALWDAVAPRASLANGYEHPARRCETASLTSKRASDRLHPTDKEVPWIFSSIRRSNCSPSTASRWGSARSPTLPSRPRRSPSGIGGVTVVKAQVKVGGRGKAGGVKVAKTPADDAFDGRHRDPRHGHQGPHRAPGAGRPGRPDRDRVLLLLPARPVQPDVPVHGFGRGRHGDRGAGGRNGPRRWPGCRSMPPSGSTWPRPARS